VHTLGKLVPDSLVLSLHHAFCLAGTLRQVVLNEPADHKRFEQFERHPFWQTTLMQAQFQAHIN
jgi:NRPS condensation-like uncharacterized protein